MIFLARPANNIIVFAQSICSCIKLISNFYFQQMYFIFFFGFIIQEQFVDLIKNENINLNESRSITGSLRPWW